MYLLKRIDWLGLYICLVLSVLSIWGIAQTNETATQKVEAEIADAQGENVHILTNSWLFSDFSDIGMPNLGSETTFARGTGVRMEDDPYPPGTPEGPEPQGGWFTPLYLAKGIVNSHIKTGSNTFSQEGSLPFSFSSDGKTRWQMEFHEYDKEMDIRSTNYLFCDGTNIFNISQSDKYVDREGNTILNTESNCIGVISKGQIPHSYRDEVGLIWLALMGGDYLLNNRAPQTYRMVDVLSTPSRNPFAWCCDFKYILMNSPTTNHIISKGYFFLNTNYISLNDTRYLGISEEDVKSDFIIPLFKKLRNINTNNLCYSIFRETGYMGVTNKFVVPIHFSSERFNGVPVEEKKKLPLSVMEGLVTNVIVANRVVPMFPKFGIVSVQDNRFRYRTKDMYRDSIYYMCTNELEIGMDSPKLREAGSQRLIKRTFRKEINYISILILVSISTLVIFFVIKHFRKQV